MLKINDTEEDLALFQNILVELLSKENNPDYIICELKKNPHLKTYEKYIDRFRPEMIAAAAELIKTWGKEYKHS